MSNLRDELIAAITAVYIKAPGNQMARVEDVADAVLELVAEECVKAHGEGWDEAKIYYEVP